MLRISKMIIVLCAVVFLGISVPIANATLTLGFYTHSLSEEEKTEAIERINLKLIHNDSNQIGIQCFDVGPDGAIALAFQSDSKGWIYVYNAAGVFEYGFTFSAGGDFGIEFYHGYLAIYFIRGNEIAIYDSSGNCIDIQKEVVPSQTPGRAKEILNRTKREVAGKQYLLERDVSLGDSYSRCVVINEDGTRTVVYDISAKHSTGQIGRLVAIVCFFVFGSWAAIRNFGKKMND